jgi:hypothetical protein
MTEGLFISRKIRCRISGITRLLFFLPAMEYQAFNAKISISESAEGLKWFRI